MSVKNLLVPGGLGFVGSNTIIEILEKTQSNVIIIDDLSNCYKDVLERIKLILSQKIKKQDLQRRIDFYQGNILDIQFLNTVFQLYVDKKQPIDGIMHFAAKKSVTQSFSKPLQYYENNLVGSLNLFKMMEKYTQCTNFIFSSTAGVYGQQDGCKQTDMKNPGSPYGQSKSCVQMLMNSLSRVHTNWKIISLRYFNPVGAHSSGLIGDEPSGFPSNLVPFIQQVIAGKRPHLNIFGKDYPTPDGTCIRDYIHITDLAIGHVLALNKLKEIEKGIQIVNLGSGNGYSVIEVLNAFQKALGKGIKHQFAERRVGDLPKLVANIQKANKFLKWTPQKDINQMCEDSVKFTLKRISDNK